MSATTSPATGSGRKARIEMRRATASETSMGVGLRLDPGGRRTPAIPHAPRVKQGSRTTAGTRLARRPQPAQPPRRASPGAPRRRGLIGGLFRSLVILVLLFGLIGPIVVVAVYRFVPPPLTWLMVQRAFEGHGFDRRWVPLDRISPQLVRSVIGAEDSRFCQHHGFDWGAIQKAMAHNEQRPGRIRGGSTISQQTAKNVFLWPHRDWVRKGLESWFTVLIEAIWGKPRIMEVYLNSIEWGPGVYGA